VAVGYQALQLNTTANNNVAVGTTAGQATTTGGNNTAIGHAALVANTTGTNLVALGYSALSGNTTAANNIGIGYQAAKATTTGGDNLAIGVNALLGNTTGNQNTIVGNGSSTTATGANNTCVGYASGNQLTSGANNTCFGLNAGNDTVRLISTASNEGVFGNNSTTGLYVKVAWTVTSDIRDKTNIGVVPHGLDFVARLNPIKYQYKVSREDDTPSGHVRYGFKAQELLELEGDTPVIINNDDPDNLKLTDQNLIAVLVNAIKELKAEFDAYKSTHP
jgi:hypothetical protein